MTYFQYLKAAVAVDKDLFELAGQLTTRKIIILNIAVLGIFFGISNLVGVVQATPDFPLTGKYAFVSPLIFSLAGVVSMCGALVGCSLIYWAAAKAFGAECGLFLAFSIMGLAAVPFWILAPLLNYSVRVQPGALYNPIILLAVLGAMAWSFKLVRASLVNKLGIPVGRSGFAVIAMWVFSVSAVYVFLP